MGRRRGEEGGVGGWEKRGGGGCRWEEEEGEIQPTQTFSEKG